MMPPPTPAMALRAASRSAARRGTAPISSIARLTRPTTASSKLTYRPLAQATCPYSTAPAAVVPAPKTLNVIATAATPVRPSAQLIRPSTILSNLPRRSESTLASKAAAPTQPTSTTTTGAAGAAAGAGEAAPQPRLLDWNTFFQLRKTRRRFQLTFSILMFVGAGFGSFVYFGTGAADAVVSQIPLDPFFTLGLMTLGCGALGWLIGPVVGSNLFYVFNRRWKTQMVTMENEFFTRIKKNRVDPTNSSAGNPVPDFYGEKISSVRGYRQWLKDQRAFNKKRTTFVS